jgi:hypothetical protein
VKLFDLYDHLKASMPRIARPDQLRCELESGEPGASFRWATLAPGGTPAGLVLFRHRYTGRIGLDKGHGDLVHVLALCTAWLQEHGGDDEHHAFLGWVGEPVDDRLSDIDLRFQFEEEVSYVAADAEYAGADRIEWQGQVYRRADLSVDTATAASIEGAIE